MMGRTSRHKLRILKFMAQNGRFIATEKVMSQHNLTLLPNFFHGMQFPVATYSHAIFFDSVVT